MLDDGKAVYEGNKTMQNLFTLEYLLGIVTPTGPAGLKGTAVYVIDGTPAVGISVELENKDKVVTVNEKGEFNFGENLASGKDKLIFKKGDQILMEAEIEIPAGTTVNEHIELPNN